MARVQCFDCDMPVVVDPDGRCPEGHDLGPVGERIEQSLGRADPHPDEPQPWIAVLDEHETTPAPETAAPRPARPISVGPTPSDEELNTGSADGLLQELHALHGGGDVDPGERSGGLSIARSSRSGETPTAPAGTSSSDPTPAPAAGTPASNTPTPPDAPDTWDDWDDWSDWQNEETPDTQVSQTDDTVHDPVAEDDGPWSAAVTQDTDAEPSTATLEQDADPEPAPAPRRAPTVRSEESLSAMAELAALLGDDAPTASPTPPTSAPSPAPTTGPAPATPPPPPDPAASSSPTPPRPAAAQNTTDATDPSDDESDWGGDHLATVSQLPLRPRPFENDRTTPPPPPPPVDPPVNETPDAKNEQVASGGSIDWANFTSKGKKRRFGR